MKRFSVAAAKRGRRNHRFLLRLLVPVAAIALINVPQLGGPTAQLGQATVADSISPLSTDMAQELRFRSAFGLDSSSAAIAAAENSSQAGNGFGVALSPPELKDMEQRSEIENNQHAVMSLVGQMTDRLGGVWVDQHADGQFVFMVLPSATQSDRAALVAALPPGASSRFEAASTSQAQLTDWVTKLTNSILLKSTSPTYTPNALTSLVDGLGLQVTSVQQKVQTNNLVIYLRALPTDMDVFKASWDTLSQQGLAPPSSLVTFAVRAPLTPRDSRSDSPGQMKSGLELHDTTGDCTSNLDTIPDGGGNSLVMTAGHCFAIGENISDGPGNTYSNFFSTFVNDSDVDAGTAVMPANGYASPNAYAQLGNYNPPQIDTISNAIDQNDIAVGDTSCMGGISTITVQCAPVAAIHVPETIAADEYYPETDLINQFEVSYPALDGDSGALGGNGPSGQGIVSASGDDDNTGNDGITSYSYLSLAIARLGTNGIFGQPQVPRTWSQLSSRFASNMCVDVENNSSSNGTPVWSYSCTTPPSNSGPPPNTAQAWSFIPAVGQPAGTYDISRFALPGMCLDADTNTAGNGGRVQEYACNNEPQQQWVLSRFGPYPSDLNLINRLEGLCLDLNIDVPGNGYAAGSPLQTYQCLGNSNYYQDNQEWLLYGGGA